MTQPLDKTTLVRAAWITELRRQGHRQCHGLGDGLNVCALDLLAEITAADERSSLFQVGALAGLSAFKVTDAINRNDGSRGYHKHTFAEIADVLEGWFK